MKSTSARLRAIYERTDGYCHVCHAKVSFLNYGRVGLRGAWEIEHSRARARGGTDHGNNLRPACIACNRVKGTVTTRTARGWNGVSRSPLSKAKKAALIEEYASAGAVVGALVGAFVGMPGMIAGAVLGHAIGSDIKPPKA